MSLWLNFLQALSRREHQRPSLASAWEPFYSSSPSFSAHSTASIASLQGKAPLPGHPKTLRDLTHITDLLTLPAAFGAIQLGETFSSCLSINNDANIDVDGVIIRVEMQTASSKALLAEFGGPNQRLGVGETLEKVVSHEIKELGQHVLGCSVSYRVPPGVRNLPPAADAQDPNIQTFRKFYKFAVSTCHSPKYIALIRSHPRSQIRFRLRPRFICPARPLHYFQPRNGRKCFLRCTYRI